MLCLEPDLLKELGCMPYVFLLQARKETKNGYMKTVRSANEPVLAIRPEDIIRNRSWEL